MKDLQKMFDRVFEQSVLYTQSGKPADYIPALAPADPRELGICVMDTSGGILCRVAQEG